MADRTAAEIEAKGLALTRAVSTATLVASFLETDAMLERKGLTAGEWGEICTARGWIMAILEERGELALIGAE